MLAVVAVLAVIAVAVVIALAVADDESPSAGGGDEGRLGATNSGSVVELRNDADNLLLLCGDDHRSIDTKINRGIYTVEYLRELKQRHEDLRTALA